MCRRKRRDPWSKKTRTNDDDREAASERTSLGFVATTSAAATYPCSSSSDGVRKQESSHDVPEGVPQKTLQTVTSTQLFLQIVETFPIKSSRSQNKLLYLLLNCGYLLTYLLLLNFILFFILFFEVVCWEGLILCFSFWGVFF